MISRKSMTLCSAVAVACCLGTNGISFAADWVRLLPRDPFAWVDLDSAVTDRSGLTRVYLSLSGNPARRQNSGFPMRLVYKAIDCKNQDAVYDVDSNGNAILSKASPSSYEKILGPESDKELEGALFKRVCQSK